MGIKEHTEQVKVVQYIRTFYPETIIAAIPNGAATTAKNRLYLYSEGLLSGFPDLIIAEAKKGFNGLFIEMKTFKGIESDNQKIIRERLINKGYLVYIARSADNAIKLIKDYLND